MPQVKLIPLNEWTKEMFRISEDVSKGNKITYKTNAKYVIIEESSNVLNTSVYFIK